MHPRVRQRYIVYALLAAVGIAASYLQLTTAKGEEGLNGSACFCFGGGLLLLVAFSSLASWHRERRAA